MVSYSEQKKTQISHFMRAEMPLSIFIISIALALLAVSSQSLWIDEANSGFKAIQPNWHSFLDLMSIERSSDIQMPGYMLALWAWAKIIGISEYGLRALNILFFLGAQAAFCFALRASAKARTFVLLAVVSSPFLCAYLDEARPYIMQFCGATLMAVAVWNTIFFSRRDAAAADLVIFCLGAVILCASSLLGVVHSLFFGLLLLTGLIMNRQLKEFFSTHVVWVIIAVTGLIMAGMGAYYFWTLTLGAKASPVGQTSIATLIFAIYELLGFSGFGPGRLGLREGGPRSLTPYIAFLILGLIPYLLAGLWFAKNRLQVPRSKRIPALAIGFFLAAAFVTVAAVGLLGHFRVVGRHFMPIAPFFFIFLGLAWSKMWDSGKWRLAVFVSILVFFGGSISQRLAYRFAKDDYRSAAAETHLASSKRGVVWWAADKESANYYGVFPVHAGEQGSVFFANSRDADYLARLPVPDIVLLSKEDIYDRLGALRIYLTEHEYKITRTFPAFTVWEPAKGKQMSEVGNQESKSNIGR
jgi:hypothetical protein